MLALSCRGSFTELWPYICIYVHTFSSFFNVKCLSFQRLVNSVFSKTWKTVKDVEVTELHDQCFVLISSIMLTASLKSVALFQQLPLYITVLKYMMPH
jgi:hypothetical protein